MPLEKSRCLPGKEVTVTCVALFEHLAKSRVPEVPSLIQSHQDEGVEEGE